MATCNCGREIGPVPHCPTCGSTNLYGRAASSVTIEHEGKRITSRGFRCRRCGTDFHELQPCEAPAIRRVTAESSSLAVATKIRTTENFDASAILEAAKARLADRRKEIESDATQINPTDLEVDDGA